MTRDKKDLRSEANSIVFDIQEEQELHNPYSQELREQNSIQTGNVAALRACWEEKYEGKVGRLAADNLRNIKNIAVGVITLSSRSAIRGGVSPELAFSMADGFIQNIEDNITGDYEVIDAIHEAQLEFTELVQRLGGSGSYNPLVRRAKDYISRYMHNKISVSEMAKTLGVNADYLSALFSRTENKTITQYILDEKLRMCENMLKYSDYSIQEISAYFSFASQSHFTQLFKRSRGITPGEYRRIYARKNK
ncbi:MAG: helix-turn-helix domain-containing protein [Clostridia bacterium]